MVPAAELMVPTDLNFESYRSDLSGSLYIYGDYKVGEVIDHVDGVTVSEAEHMMATRLWQNTAKVHFDATARPDGRRLIYGGHVISMARALSSNGLGNVQMIAAINAGAHANPCFAGDTIRAWSEVLDLAETATSDCGCNLRLRLVATKGTWHPILRDCEGKYLPRCFTGFGLLGLHSRARCKTQLARMSSECLRVENCDHTGYIRDHKLMIFRCDG